MTFFWKVFFTCGLFIGLSALGLNLNWKNTGITSDNFDKFCIYTMTLSFMFLILDILCAIWNIGYFY